MQKLLLTLFLGALALTIFWVIFNPTPENEPVGGETLWQSYSNPDFGFELRVPQGFEAEDSYFYYALGPGREIPGIAFRMPESLVEGTNLSRDTAISVEQLSRAACKPSDFLSYSATGTKEIIGGNSFTVATSSDAGAGNFYEETVYVTKQRDVCYGIRFLIHSTNIANYPEGTVTPFNKDGVISTFRTILGTIRFI